MALEEEEPLELHLLYNKCICTENSKDSCLHQALADGDVKTPISERERLATNCDDELPLHVACKDENKKKFVKMFLSNCSPETKRHQLTAQNMIFGNTPLHVAAFLGNEAIVETIMKNCDLSDVKELLQQRNRLGDTPVHAAAAKNHNLSILDKMYEKGGEYILTLEGRFQGLPIHAACGYGQIKSVEKLVKWDRKSDQLVTLKTASVPADLPAFANTTEPKQMTNEEKEEYKKTIKSLRSKEERREVHAEYTPLTRACQFGHYKIVKLLLEEGAKQHHLALIKAVEGLYYECVELLLLEKDLPLEHLCEPYFTFDDTLIPTTVFRELIKHMPDFAELVLNYKCVKLERFLVNSKNFKIKLDYKLVDCYGQSWDTNEVIQRNYTRSLSVTPDADQTDYEAAIKVNRTTGCGNFDFSKETHPLSLMVKHKREKLLTHPVVASLIHDKWKSIYGVINIGHWLLYVFVYMLFTNLLLLTLPNPSGGYCTKGNGSSGMCSLNLESMDCDSTLAGAINPTVSSNSTFAFATLMLIYSLLRIIFELTQFFSSILVFCCRCTSRKSLYAFYAAFKQADYIWDLTNWIEMPLFIISIMFSIVVLTMKNEGFCLLNWQWQMGAVILWLSWIELIFLSTQFKIIGVHALMFMKILKTLVKFIPLALCLIIGFALTFHYILFQPHLLASPYSSGGYSLLKTLALTVGDLDTDSFFGFDIRGQAHDTSHVQYMGLSTFFWILSLIFMTILLSNLMIGLAVGDIQTIINKAIFKNLVLQVDYLLTAESSWLFRKFLRKFGNKGKKEFEPNKLLINMSVLGKELVYFIWGGVRFDSQESIEKLISSAKEIEEKTQKRLEK